MASKRSVHRQPSRFTIADLPDHYYVWILTEKRPQPVRKRESYFRFDLCLVNSCHLIFNRIFDGGNIDFRLIQNIKHSIKCSSFSTPSRTCGEHHSCFLG